MMTKMQARPQTKPVRDAQVEEMVANPEAYFEKVRTSARAEARKYVANRSNERPAPRHSA
jgi:hypothetical protein